jgi:hypothetical protein
VAAYLGRGVARAAQNRPVEARTDLETGLRLLPDSDPDPQLDDLEIAARRALESLPPSPASPSPIASPAASPLASPGVSVTPAPAASPPASPVALRPMVEAREPLP